MRKGFVTAIVTMFTVVFIGTGTLYSSVIINDSFEETIEYNTGDTVTVSKAKLKADLYPDKMRKELNYSLNKEMAEDERKDLTTVDTLPLQNLQNNVLDRVRTQNRVLGCTKPSIEDIRVSGSSYIVSLSGDSITCEGSSAEADISFGKSELEVNKPESKYLGMLNDALSLRTSFQEEAPNEVSDFQGYDDGDACLEDRETEVDEAVEDAESSLQSSSLSSLAGDAADSTSITSGISISHDTSFETSIDTDISRESCTEIVGCNERRIEGDPTSKCVDPETEDGYSWDVNATLSVDEIQGEFDLENEKVSLVTGVRERSSPEYRFEVAEAY